MLELGALEHMASFKFRVRSGKDLPFHISTVLVGHASGHKARRLTMHALDRRFHDLTSVIETGRTMNR